MPTNYSEYYDPAAFYAREGRSSSPEDKMGRIGLQAVIAGGGYLGDAKRQAQGAFARDLGAQRGLETALLNERLSPGMRGTAFADAARSQLYGQQLDAEGRFAGQLEQQGQDRVLQSLNLLFGSEEANAVRRAQEKASKNALWGKILEGAGMGIGKLLVNKGDKDATASSRKFKKDIRPVSKRKLASALESIDLKTYKYKDGMPEDDGREHVGMIAEEAPDMLRVGQSHISLSDALGMAIGSIQDIMSRLDKLEKSRGSYG